VLAGLKNPKIWVVVFTLICITYFIFALDRARLLIQQGNVILTLFAFSIVTVPGLGLYLIAREIRFGFTMQEMGRELARTGQLPADDLPKEESGRSMLAAADARFESIAQSHDSDDWVKCYLLALAYDESRDRKAARASMREAARLFRSAPPSE
jgi:hypothetical protein